MPVGVALVVELEAEIHFIARFVGGAPPTGIISAFGVHAHPSTQLGAHAPGGQRRALYVEVEPDVAPLGVGEHERIVEPPEVRRKVRIGGERFALGDHDFGRDTRLAQRAVSEPRAAALAELENGARGGGLGTRGPTRLPNR